MGGITQAIKLKKKRNLNQEWELKSEGDVLYFSIDGVPMMKIRYMPLEYSGFGYYVWGKQELEVDDVEFIQ